MALSGDINLKTQFDTYLIIIMTIRINTIIATPMKTAKITDCMSARFVQMLVF